MVTQPRQGRGFWAHFDQFRDEHIRTPLIGRPTLGVIIAALAAIAITAWLLPAAIQTYMEIRVTLPAALISIAGFTITALSILMATAAPDASKDSTGSYIRRRRPDMWRPLIRTISGVAKLAGLLTIIVLLEIPLRTVLDRFLVDATVDRAWVCLVAFLGTLLSMNILRVLWLIERTAAPLPEPD